jgi:hypothetical protein
MGAAGPDVASRALCCWLGTFPPRCTSRALGYEIGNPAKVITAERRIPAEA